MGRQDSTSCPQLPVIQDPSTCPEWEIQREPGGAEQKEEWEGPPRGHPSPLTLPLITVMTEHLRLNNNRGFPLCAY